MDPVVEMALAIGLADLSLARRCSTGALADVFFPDERLGVVAEQVEKRQRLFGCLRARWSFLLAEGEKACQRDEAVLWLYPAVLRRRLQNLSVPPLFLFCRGSGRRAFLEDRPAVAVVGSRRPSAYGIEVTKRAVSGLVAKGITVVSGGARGIDGVAHRTALTQGGLTVAILAHGLDQVYPPEHRSLFAGIAEGGLLLSEYRPGQRPQKSHFVARNRLIAGLSDLVLVSEAKAASGTLITAGFAADQGKDVFAVPGSILEAHSASCHLLISEGAGLFTSVDDLPF